jgi:xanthine dehydrogenase molybdenum-binding subunit
MGECSVVGKRLPLKDAAEKVTGVAVFTSDIKLHGMLYAKVLRSPHPHARVVRVDTSQAEQLPGVKAVLSKNNAPRSKVPLMFGEQKIFNFALDKVAFDDKVRYAGEEVAAVAATSEKIAEEALQLIKVDYEELPAVLDVEEAIKPGASPIHDDRTKNIAAPVIMKAGDVEAGFKEADCVLEEIFKTQSQRHASIEKHSCVANFDASGNLTAWVSHQAPSALQELLSEYLDMPASKIRVIKPYLGGGFGSKLDMHIEHIAALLSRMAGKPVKLTLSREEVFTTTVTRHAAVVRLKIGAKKDGTLTAIQSYTLTDEGAYLYHLSVLTVLARGIIAFYRCPNVSFQGYAVYTNHTIAGPMRGYGHPQSGFAMETMMDMIAEKLGLDPIAIRLKNFTASRMDAAIGTTIPISGLPECLKRGAEKIGWTGRETVTRPGAKKRRGIGMACFTNGAGGGGPHGRMRDYSAAFVKLNADGTAQLITGATDLGTGCNTTLSQIVAEELGLNLDDVAVTAGDTAAVPYDSGAFSSRTLFMNGLAVRAAAADVKQQVFRRAGELLGAEPEDLEVKGGKIFTKLDPTKGMTFSEVTREAAENVRGGAMAFLGKATCINPGYADSYGAAFVEVEVDTETGQVEVLKAVAVQDVGKAINPMVVEGQIEGGFQQMIGYALTEDAILDKKTGAMLNPTFANYMFLTSADMPEVDASMVEVAAPTGPYGARGMSEGITMGVAPAIANAIYNAVDLRLKELPMTPERVFTALAHLPQLA